MRADGGCESLLPYRLDLPRLDPPLDAFDRGLQLGIRGDLVHRAGKWQVVLFPLKDLLPKQEVVGVRIPVHRDVHLLPPELENTVVKKPDREDGEREKEE